MCRLQNLLVKIQVEKRLCNTYKNSDLTGTLILSTKRSSSGHQVLTEEHTRPEAEGPILCSVAISVPPAKKTKANQSKKQTKQKTTNKKPQTNNPQTNPHKTVLKHNPSK